MPSKILTTKYLDEAKVNRMYLKSLICESFKMTEGIMHKGSKSYSNHFFYHNLLSIVKNITLTDVLINEDNAVYLLPTNCSHVRPF